MIVFDLECICGCQFEGWFSCRTDYEQQRVDGLIGCPQCGSDEIHKILSPVAIHSGSSFPCVPAKQDEQHEIKPEEALRFLRSVQDFFEKNFDDVGPKFAEESLKIHYGVAEPRNIRGVATIGEEKMLREEGIEVLKLPMLKKTSDPELN